MGIRHLYLCHRNNEHDVKSYKNALGIKDATKALYAGSPARALHYRRDKCLKIALHPSSGAVFRHHHACAWDNSVNTYLRRPSIYNKNRYKRRKRVSDGITTP